MTPPSSLVTRVNSHGYINQLSLPRPLLTLEEFFEGNDNYGSIGCNLPDVRAITIIDAPLITLFDGMSPM